MVDRQYLPFDQKFWAKISRQTRKFYPTGLSPCAYTDIVNSYSGGKKRIYVRALENLKVNGLRQRDKLVKMFVKPDRYPSGDIVDKDPRAIQYRGPEFNLELSRYIKPFEHAIYSSVTMGVVSGTRVIAKGLNNVQRAALIMEKASRFNDPIFVLLDHSRFDSTINVEHLKSTHAKYQRAFRSKSLQSLLNVQKHNLCYSSHGIKYRTTGTRMSGDADTGCGNSVVNADVLWGFLKMSKVIKYDFILDGDDSIVFIERADQKLLQMGLFARMGFDTKIQIVDDIHQAEFCQCRLVLTDPPVMVRNPRRVISHAQCCKRVYGHHVYPKWLAAVGLCEMSMNYGVPILQSFGYQLSKLSKIKFFDDEYKWKMTMADVKWKPKEVTDQARVSFYLAWGTPPGLQELMEKENFTSNVENVPRFNKVKNQFKFRHYVRASKSLSRAQSLYRSFDESSSGSWWCPG